MLALLLLLPVWAQPTINMPGQVQDTLFVIDVSESMNVPDTDFPMPHSPRLELAKTLTRESMAALTCGSRVALALFAGEQIVVLFEPLEVCRHFAAIDQVVARLTTHMRWIGDSRVEAGLVQAMEEAKARKLAVVMMTDGDEMPHRSAPRITGLERLRGQVRGVVVAIGGDVPHPVPRVDGYGDVVGYWTPEEAVKEGFHPNLLAVVDALAPGQQAADGVLDEVGEHLSAARPAYLATLSSAAGLMFISAKNPSDVLASLKRSELVVEASAERDARWLLGVSALVMVLLGWFWGPLTASVARIRDRLRRPVRP